MKTRFFVLGMIAFSCLYGARADTFSYDAVGRLVKSTESNGKSYDYSYDPAGNLVLFSPVVVGPVAAVAGVSRVLGVAAIAGPKGNGIADWWEKKYFGTTGIDPLGKGVDGVPYLMKFALGLDPTLNVAPWQLPEVTVDGSNMSLVFRKSRAASNLVFVVQSSNDLSRPWTDLTKATEAALALPPLSSDDISDSYKVSIPLDGNKQFMRLKVSNPENPNL